MQIPDGVQAVPLQFYRGNFGYGVFTICFIVIILTLLTHKRYGGFGTYHKRMTPLCAIHPLITYTLYHTCTATQPIVIANNFVHVVKVEQF